MSLRLALSKEEEGEKKEEEETLESLEKRFKEAAGALMGGDESQETLVDRLDEAIKAHPEFAARRLRERRAFDDNERSANLAAYKEQIKFVPAKIACMSFEELVDFCGGADIAKRVFQKRCLWLLRLEPERLEKIHPVDLRDRYVLTQGFDLIELRALFHAIQAAPRFLDNDPSGAKLNWAEDLRSKLADLIQRKDLPSNLKRHPVYKTKTSALRSLQNTTTPSKPATKKKQLFSSADKKRDNGPPSKNKKAGARENDDNTTTKKKKKTPRRPLFKNANGDLLAAIQKRRQRFYRESPGVAT